jgi:hypothetical protein
VHAALGVKASLTLFYRGCACPEERTTHRAGMGILASRWEADYEGHRFTISRNEVTRGFRVEYDGRIVSKKRWSLVGLGELRGMIEHGGRELPVKVELTLMSGCVLAVGGRRVATRTVA